MFIIGSKVWVTSTFKDFKSVIGRFSLVLRSLKEISYQA